MGDMRKALYELLPELMEDNPRLALLLSDIGMWVFRQVKGKFPARYFNFGISEAAAVGAAAGMAMRGAYPVLFTWTPFITSRVFEQIKVNLAARNLNAIIVSVAGSYDQGYLGPTHQCPEDVGILYNIPGMQIAAPGNETEFRYIFRYAASVPGLYYIRLATREHDGDYIGEPGEFQVVSAAGGGVTAICFGDVLPRVVEAVGEDANILYSPWVRPLSMPPLRFAPESEIKLLVVEPWYETLTMPIVAAYVDEGRPAIIKSHAIPRRFIQSFGFSEEIDAEVGQDAAGIRKAFEELRG